MSTGISTRQKLLCQLEEIDRLLKDISDKVNRKSKFDDIDHSVLLLLDQDKEYKSTLITAAEQMETQVKIEKLKADCAASDVKIQACQKQLKKSELLLTTALYYCRQKLDSMVDAVKSPIEVDDLVKFSHRISSSYGALAPDNWTPGDPKRPYPNKEEIRRGYLGHLDDSGKFLTTLGDAILQMQPSVTNTPASALATPGCIGATPGQMSGSLQLHPVQQHNLASVTPANNENPFAFSPSIGLPGVNMVSSPGMPPSNGSGGGGTHWTEGCPPAVHHPPSYPSTGSRLPASSSLVAMLTGTRGGPSDSPSLQAPSSGAGRSSMAWQQTPQPPHSSQRFMSPQQQPQPHRKRQFPSEEQRMHSDNSDEDGGGGGERFMTGQQYQPPPPHGF